MLAEINYDSTTFHEHGVQKWHLSEEKCSALVKLMEDPASLNTILVKGGELKEEKDKKAVTDKLTSAMVLSGAAAIQDLKSKSKSKHSAQNSLKKKKGKDCGAAFSLVPLPSAASSAPKVEYNSKSFTRKKEGREAMRSAMLEGYQAFKDFYNMVDDKGNVAVNGKTLRSQPGGQACSWQKLADLSVDYFLAKYSLKSPASFGLCVSEEIRAAVANVNELMKLAKRIVLNFLTPDLLPVKFGDKVTKGTK